MLDYLKFWNVSEPVFNRTLDSNRAFFPNSFQPKIEHLLSFAGQPKTVTVIAGESGSGKSTAAKWIYSFLDYKKHDTLLIQATEHSIHKSWITTHLCEYLTHDKAKNLDHNEKINHISIALDQLIEEKRTLIVVIDSFENLLNDDNIKELQSLYHLQALSGSCLSFVLIGDFDSKNMEQGKLSHYPKLQNLVSYECVLENYSLDETKKYIDFYCQLAGLKKCPFTKEALSQLYAETQGVPAKINKIAESCLIAAAAGKSDKVTNAIAGQFLTNKPASKKISQNTKFSNPTQSRVADLPSTSITQVESMPEPMFSPASNEANFQATMISSSYDFSDARDSATSVSSSDLTNKNSEDSASTTISNPNNSLAGSPSFDLSNADDGSESTSVSLENVKTNANSGTNLSATLPEVPDLPANLFNVSAKEAAENTRVGDTPTPDIPKLGLQQGSEEKNTTFVIENNATSDGHTTLTDSPVTSSFKTPDGETHQGKTGKADKKKNKKMNGDEESEEETPEKPSLKEKAINFASLFRSPGSKGDDDENQK